MDTARIKAFLLSAKRNSFSKAAEELSYTPSALSHIADDLEAELGVKLLNRTYSGVSLTENGQKLLPKLQEIINAESQLFDCAKNLSAENQVLRIGTYSSIAQYILPEIIKKFKNLIPQAKVSIKVGNDLKNWLDQDVADVIFTDRKPENANWIKIMDDPFLVVAPNDILPSEKSVHREQLYDYTCIMHNEGTLNSYFDRSKFKEIIPFDSIDESSVISMVKEKIGIAVLPALMLKKKSKQLHTIKLIPQISRTIGLAYKKEAVQKTCTAKFIKFINGDITKK